MTEIDNDDWDAVRADATRLLEADDPAAAAALLVRAEGGDPGECDALLGHFAKIGQ